MSRLNLASDEEDCKEIAPDMMQERSRIVDLQVWGRLRGLDATTEKDAECGGGS